MGIAGSPGSGKSTLAADLAERLGGRALVVGMDGFHLATSVLTALGLSDVKGAPETFDASGFVAMLRRIRGADAAMPVYAPVFDRALEEPIAGAVEITAAHEIVVVEGNYLLADGAWSEARDLLDMVVFIDIDPALRVERLIERHVHHGRSHDEAREWVERNDEANARLVEATRHHADYVVQIP